MINSASKINPYYDLESVDQSVKDGYHREAVGGMWDETGWPIFGFLFRNTGRRAKLD